MKISKCVKHLKQPHDYQKRSRLSADNLKVSTLDATNFISRVFIDVNDINIVHSTNTGTADTYEFVQIPHVDKDPDIPENEVAYKLPEDVEEGTLLYDAYNQTVKAFVGNMNEVATYRH